GRHPRLPERGRAACPPGRRGGRVSWEEWATGPVATLIAGIGGAVVAQASYWLHVRRRTRARQSTEAVGLERARLDHDETANERLFRNFSERLQLSLERYDEVEQQKHELEARLNVSEGTVIRLTAALDI